MAGKKETFEDHLKQVEDVVRALESGKLGLEESIERYEAGIRAIKECYKILEAAEKKIQILAKDREGRTETSAAEPTPAA
jgi:exodeoxyribonuclease VII small subunit